MREMHDNNDTHQDEQRQQEQQSQRAGDGEGQMQSTQTLHAGTEALQQRTFDIIAQIDELTALGANFIDELKQAFLTKMAEARQEIEGHANKQMNEWAMQSNATFDLEKRLQVATQLMGSLEARFGSR